MTLEGVASLAGAQGIQLITITAQKEMLAASGVDPVGSKNSDVTVVEYFDYNCPYCKKFSPTLQALLAQDNKVPSYTTIGRSWGMSPYTQRNPP